MKLISIHNKKRVRLTEPVQVNSEIKIRVAKAVAGTKETIGSFYDEAVKERLKTIKQSKTK